MKARGREIVSPQLDWTSSVVAGTSSTPGHASLLAARPHCAAGHPYTKQNTRMRNGTQRVCRQCVMLRARKQADRIKAERAAAREARASIRAAQPGAGLRRREKNKGKRRRAANKLRLDAIKSSTPCVDCGACFHPEVMEYDHRDGAQKYKAISRMMGLSWSTIEIEMAKCDLVCANCHRMRTFNRRRSAKRVP